MQKILQLTVVLMAISLNAHSQVNANALGLRIYKGETIGAELSYQGSGTGRDRLEIDLGYENNDNQERYYLVLNPHSVWGNITKGLNGYGGTALEMGYLPDSETVFRSLTFGFGAQVGLEYDFNKYDTPILVSLDGRYIFGFAFHDNYDLNLAFNVALSVRYVW